MRLKKFLFGFLSTTFLVLGIAAIFFWHFYLDEKLNMTEVVVAAETLEPNTKLHAENVRIELRDIHSIPTDAFTTVEELLDADTPILIQENDVITAFKMSYNPLSERTKKIFPIPNSWIESIPGTLNRHDKIDIHLVATKIKKTEPSLAQMNGEGEDDFEVLPPINEYEPLLTGIIVEYVKDSSNREIRVSEGGEETRLDLSSNPSRVELQLDDEEFYLLRDKVDMGYTLLFSY